MAKEIVPHKLIISYKEDGSIDKSILLYRLREDGVLDSKKFLSVNVSNGIDIALLLELATKSKEHAEKGERIKEQ